MKSLINLFAVVSCVTLSLVVLSPAARADTWNKKTIVTINDRIQVPNDTVLEPGEYVFKLLDSQSDRHIVQIFNADENHIITTILAIPNYRLQPTGKSVFAFWETAAGEPPALRAWFYPGDNFGQEFKYRPVQFARIGSRSTTVTAQTNQEETSRVEERTEVAQNTAPAAPPEPTPAPEPVVAEPAPQSPVVESPAAPEPERVQADQPAELPHTASSYPLITLVGLLSLGAFAITGIGSKRTL
jgi:hypothetical protein